MYKFETQNVPEPIVKLHQIAFNDRKANFPRFVPSIIDNEVKIRLINTIRSAITSKMPPTRVDSDLMAFQTGLPR